MMTAGSMSTDDPIDPIIFQPKIHLDQNKFFLTNFKFSIHYIPPLTKYQKYRKIFRGNMNFSLVCVKTGKTHRNFLRYFIIIQP